MHWGRTILIEHNETTLIKENYSQQERWILHQHRSAKTTTFLPETQHC